MIANAFTIIDAGLCMSACILRMQDYNEIWADYVDYMSHQRDKGEVDFICISVENIRAPHISYTYPKYPPHSAD